ncbi:hypothetical protein JTE90_010892 [Oedothorax gibbosus]|uniref:E3 ubiquitin-protein ligase RNF10 n=1 Tax=Oedothorax gibbosus TaxID=931172 RepID=A0AAV6UHL9_9ARAC|nr:hypothetical protein JTE90_010892 [Oedothorax gibbosus]
MEKANTKTSSAPKPNSSDTRNKQDGGRNKHLRVPRVKEGTSPRPDDRRRPNPQKSRELFDKRPRNRTGAFCERYRSEIADGAVGETPGKQGCKKMNLNHLLNFTLAPLDNWDGNGRRAICNRPKLPKYNKELFLQANCQFVAKDNGNYSVPQKNPDTLVEWSIIEEIRLPCYEVPLCPICLYVPVAAKITRCGHIYCWPCLLHYLSLTDKTWQKCPICFEAVHKTDLKSVSLSVRKCFSVGDEITMILMQREKGSLLSTPVVHQIPSNSVCNVNDDDAITRYQKLLLASRKEVQLILDRERCELDTAYLKEKDTPEVCFIESALQLLSERETALNKVVDIDTNPIAKETSDGKVDGNVRNHLTSISSTDSNDESFYNDMNANPANSNTLPNSNNIAKIAAHDSEKGVSFFYQAEDGQHIYLHNVNVRMLLKEFGSLESAPQSIKAKIVEVERVTMTEGLRKRLRYLQHLPLTCEFQFVELEFKSIVSEPTMQQFEDEIKKRRFVRNRKARDERRREKMIEQEENKKLGKYPKATYNLQSVDQFPAYHPEDFAACSPPKNEMTHERQTPDSSISNVNNNYSEDFPGGHLDEPSPTYHNYAPVTSFAQMLRGGQKTFNSSPKQVQPVPMWPISMQPNPDSEDESTPAPEYRQSFSDAFQLALDKISLQEPKDKSQNSSKKKKKAKKQLLFTTAMCRNNNN